MEDKIMNENEKAGNLLRRLLTVLDAVPGGVTNGQVLDPVTEAEIEVVFAEARVLGLLPEKE